MTRQVLIFLHMDDEDPGYIADYLYKKGITDVFQPFDTMIIVLLEALMPTHLTHGIGGHWCT